MPDLNQPLQWSLGKTLLAGALVLVAGFLWGRRRVAAALPAPAEPAKAATGVAGIEALKDVSMTSVLVGATPVKILAAAASGGPRNVMISADQSIRVSPDRRLLSRPELGMPAGGLLEPIKLGSLPRHQELFAVVAPGGATANVTLWLQAA